MELGAHTFAAFSEGRGSEVLKWIVGAEGILSGEGDELVGVTVVDDRTLRVTLASALPNFPDLLAEPAATVLHRPNVEMWGFDWSSWQTPDASPRPPWYFDELPVGTGPFALTEFDFWDLTATFVRNEHYWDEPSGPDRIELVSIDFHIDNLAPDVSLDERAVDVVCGIAESASPSSAEEVSGPVPVRFSVPSELELLVLDPSADEMSDTDFRRSLAASVTRPMATSGRAWTDIGPFGSVGWREASGVLPPELAVGMQGGDREKALSRPWQVTHR